jgi:uncharacterized protein YggU (UPF0235/DUF167 family)
MADSRVPLMRDDDKRPWCVRGSAVHLRVRLTPRGGRDSVEAVSPTPDGPAVKARVRAVPENGAANAALETLIATWLGVPGSGVALASGHKSRTKLVAITGEPRKIEPLLAAAISSLEPQIKEAP